MEPKPNGNFTHFGHPTDSGRLRHYRYHFKFNPKIIFLLLYRLIKEFFAKNFTACQKGFSMYITKISFFLFQ